MRGINQPQVDFRLDTVLNLYRHFKAVTGKPTDRNDRYADLRKAIFPASLYAKYERLELSITDNFIVEAILATYGLASLKRRYKDLANILEEAFPHYYLLWSERKPFLQGSIAKLSSEWIAFEKTFFTRVRKVTGIDWKSSVYPIFIVDASGLYDDFWEGYTAEVNLIVKSIIVMGFVEPIESGIEILAHELTHSNLLEALQRVVQENGVRLAWAGIMNELVAQLVLGELGLFRPEGDHMTVKYVKEKYRKLELDPLIDTIASGWTTREGNAAIFVGEILRRLKAQILKTDLTRWLPEDILLSYEKALVSKI